MSTNKQTVERDFYYKREVNRKHKLKVWGFSLGGHLMTYLVITAIRMAFPFMSFSSNSFGVSYVIMGALVCIPVAIILPHWAVRMYLSHLIPRIYSLADDPNEWRKKAVQLISICEPVRFVLGLLPLSFTRFGSTTAPATFVIYSYFYLYPTEKYDQIIMNYSFELVDILVFLLIYLAYFVIYEYFFLKYIRKQMIRQRIYLEGELAVREKYYNYNKRKFDD